MFIFYDNFLKEKANMRNTIFLEMKNYSLNHEDKRFHTHLVKKEEEQTFYTLYEDIDSLYILVPSRNPTADISKKEMMMIVSPAGMIMVPYAKDATEVVKVWYPKADYSHEITQMRYHIFGQLLFFSLGALIVALLAAWYTLRPLRSSLHLLEDFIKDIIHDINTPLTSIVLNLKIIDEEIKEQNEEIEDIRIATQTIEMLHHNLDAYIREQKQTNAHFSVKEVLETYIKFFTPMYDYLRWEVEIEECVLFTDRQAFERIIYNLLSNACKYNIDGGTIKITMKDTRLSIRNSSYGVSHPEKVFERFYKESERGLGIGLHIVDKLCSTLQIEKKFLLEGTDVIVALECKNITHELLQ